MSKPSHKCEFEIVRTALIGGVLLLRKCRICGFLDDELTMKDLEAAEKKQGKIIWDHPWGREEKPL